MEPHPSKRGAMEEEHDRLSGLPDDLLHSILRSLPLRHAARTSALSRRWARRWLRALASSAVLDFTDRDFARGQPPARAAATVGLCLRLHAEHGAPLDVLRVSLVCPSADAGAFGRDAVGWVATAVARGARELEVDLTHTAGGQDGDGSAFLELPGDLFLAKNSLERFALGGFSLRAVPSGAAGLAGLRSLSLSHADVTDEAVRGLLSSCRDLEFLSLRCCHQLTSVKIAGDKLRVLELVGCPAVRELRVAATALESFCFHGDIVYSTDDDRVPAVDLGATPALRDAYLSHLGFGDIDNDPDDHEYAYSDLLSCVAHARTLTLCSAGLMLAYDTDVNGMTNLQELQLLMASLDEDDDLERKQLGLSSLLESVSSFFQVTPLPLLERLFIRIPGDPAGGTAAALTGELNDSGIFLYGYDIVLDHLRFIKVVNFHGTRCELKLLVFLMKRAPALEDVVLVTVEAEGAPGDEWLKILQGRLSAMPMKASPEARVTVCRPSGDGSRKPAHRRFYHEE
ncbi:hypothetical protein ACP70R_030204 [Stipagrostis hirtigluma subsp. patula]